MASLFFWRKKKSAEPVPTQISPAVLAAAPGATPVQEVAQLPARRLVYALALNDPRAGDPEATPDATQTQLLLAASQQVTQLGTAGRYMPPRPSLLPQLLDAVNDEEASLRVLSRLVSQDPQLTAKCCARRTARSTASAPRPSKASSAPRPCWARAACAR